MINYTLKQLYSFEAVVRLGGFTSASKELHITQPAVYMQVQQLQKNIGAKLFNINGKTITPTYIGKKIYETAVKTINVVENSKLEIEQSLNPNSGHLQIAVATTANSFVSNLLSKFKIIIMEEKLIKTEIPSSDHIFSSRNLVAQKIDD